MDKSKMTLQTDFMKQLILANIYDCHRNLLATNQVGTRVDNFSSPSSTATSPLDFEHWDIRMRARCAFEHERMTPELAKTLHEAGIPTGYFGMLLDSFKADEIDFVLEGLNYNSISNKLNALSFYGADAVIHFIDVYNDLLDFGIITSLRIYLGFINRCDIKAAWSECRRLVNCLRRSYPRTALLHSIFSCCNGLPSAVSYVIAYSQIGHQLDVRNPFYFVSREINQAAIAMEGDPHHYLII